VREAEVLAVSCSQRHISCVCEGLSFVTVVIWNLSPQAGVLKACPQLVLLSRGC
jgi:hypothetical protein